MRRRLNPCRQLASLTFRDLALLDPDTRRLKGLPPLPPVPAPELSSEMLRLRNFFAPQPKITQEADDVN